MKKSRERRLARLKESGFPEFSEQQLDYLETNFIVQDDPKDSEKKLRWKAAQRSLVMDIINMQLELNQARIEGDENGHKKSPGRLDD